MNSNHRSAVAILTSVTLRMCDLEALVAYQSQTAFLLIMMNGDAALIVSVNGRCSVSRAVMDVNGLAVTHRHQWFPRIF